MCSTVGMMKPNVPLWINQHVAAELPPIFTRNADAFSFEDQFHVADNRCRIQNAPPRTLLESIGTIELSRGVKQQRPRQIRVACVKLAEIFVVESDDFHFDFKLIESFLISPQLRQI